MNNCLDSEQKIGNSPSVCGCLLEPPGSVQNHIVLEAPTILPGERGLGVSRLKYKSNELVSGPEGLNPSNKKQISFKLKTASKDTIKKNRKRTHRKGNFSNHMSAFKGLALRLYKEFF